jgi:hypothetical protein
MTSYEKRDFLGLKNIDVSGNVAKNRIGRSENNKKMFAALLLDFLCNLPKSNHVR